MELWLQRAAAKILVNQLNTHALFHHDKFEKWEE